MPTRNHDELLCQECEGLTDELCAECHLCSDCCDCEEGFAVIEDCEDDGDELDEDDEATEGEDNDEMISKVTDLAERRLRKVIRDAPTSERQVQDAFENLLIGAGIPHSREAKRIEFSSKTYIPDFTVETVDLAIEIKLCNRKEREKEIIAEINDDVAAYTTEYDNLLFVIYDTGFIRDVDRFTGHIEDTEGVVVRVVKH
jgi:REase_DpnII-MboI